MPPRKRQANPRALKAVPPQATPVPIKSTRRNTQADRDFIEEHKREFSVYEGQLVWNGTAADLGSPFQLPPDQHRCTFTIKRRDEEGGAILDRNLQSLEVRCPKWGMLLGSGRGTLHLCVDHAGGTNAVKLAVQARLAAAADAMAGRMIDIALSGSTDAADAIRAIEKSWDRIGIRGGAEISLEVPGWKRVWDRMVEEDGGGGTDAGADQD